MVTLTNWRSMRSLVLGIIVPIFVTFALIIAAICFAQERGSRYSKNAGPESILKNPLSDINMPAQVDVRGGTPRGLDLRQPTEVQLKALSSLRALLGDDLSIRYNGLTATPMNISKPGSYLTEPSALPKEQIALDFIRRWREVFRFSEDDLNSLKLVSRATSAEGITIMLFQQQAGGLPVYHGEVLVNVNRIGQIMNVAGDSFPRLNVNNVATISAAQAVTSAAASMNVVGFIATSLGTAKILTTHGDLTPEYSNGTRFARSVFGDEIAVETVVFPMGDTGRVAYKFNLVTSQFHGTMWMNIVDAQTGAILKRTSLTSYTGGPGGGNSIPRKGTFRPDVQNMVEAYNGPGTAFGKVFDTNPVGLSKVGGTGRAVRTGTDFTNFMIARPTYDAEDVGNTNPWRYSLLFARREVPLSFLDPGQAQAAQSLTPTLLGQLTRGFPDATSPTASSPFGWFYLPTGASGAEITSSNTNTATTRAAGYTMSAEAQARNLAINSPNGNGTQPFAASLTSIPSITLADGRVLTSVFQSKYTEGNNVVVSDDHENDDDVTRGVKGYAANRQFNAAYYDYYAYYELGGTDASGGGTGSTTPVTYPASANPDIYPDASSLFYFNNVEHDYLYSIGFTEPFWNFQFDNFGKGGAGGDAIIAETQDGSGTDNANMGTPADGASPRMQMYLFTDGGFRRSDGDLDWDVIAHEHYHGVSNRSAAKGGDSCLGTPLVGESGGMGEGWSDSIASSLSDDDNEGEYVTGQADNGIRRLAYTNYRYSYGAINNVNLNVRKNANTDVAGPDQNSTQPIPFEVHDVGEVWAAMLWDMRELMIVKQKVNGTYPGIFFDGSKRSGAGATFYIGDRPYQSVDLNHPINYRQSFATDNGTALPFPALADPTVNATRDIIRPTALATEYVTHPNRDGDLATAVSRGARLADTIILRGLQLAPCNPTFVDMRDSMLMADREITGGENQAIIWRALASHGVGVNATSTGKTNGTGQQGAAAAIVEDFTVSADVTACETLGPPSAPSFTLTNPTANTVNISISSVSGATSYVIARSTSANGPYLTIATVTGTSYSDNDGGTGLVLGQTYYYQVHAGRNSSCVGVANTQNISIMVGAPLSPAPNFAGIGKVADPKTGKVLFLSWAPATSSNPAANIVYDIYRVLNVDNSDNSNVPATFTPAAGNRIAQGVTGTSYTDGVSPNLTLGQQYYYIVQARDTTNGKVDTNNVGNTVTKFNAPSTTAVSTTVPFALENFENSSADTRFTPPLIDESAVDQGTPVFQRVTGVDLSAAMRKPGSVRGGRIDKVQATTTVMFAPDFDPGSAGQGGPSNFITQINPTNLTRASFLEFDHKFGAEASFDGATLEVVLGAPSVTGLGPTFDNTTMFDLDDYIVDNGYTGNLDGALVAGVVLSPLNGRRAFTGTRALSHVKVALGDFAPGGAKNPNSLPVYLVFHMTSDVGTFVDGWYIDNLVVNTYIPTVSTAANVTVAGRVLSSSGNPVGSAVVTITDQDGTSRSFTTTRNGEYQFDNILSGANYTISASQPRYRFSPRIVSVTDNVTGFDLQAEP